MRCIFYVKAFTLTDLSCPSFANDFLLRLAILALQLSFLAGPIFMDVFSNGVVVTVTLLPL